MILTEEKKIKVEGHQFEAQESKINEDKLVKLFGVLSGLYRNKPGSIVREITSNAVDANTEAYHFKTLEYDDLKKQYSWIEDPKFNITPDSLKEIKRHLTKAGEKEPIIIKIDYEKSEISIRDFGIGLSPERAKYVYFNYLDSTKEDTDDLLGGFGIGSKSPLSYRDNFFIDSVYNGTKYSYMMSKNEYGKPQHELLLVEDNVSEDNGTTVRVPFKQYSDYIDFAQEIKKQLTYIDNIYFIDGASEDNPVNKKTIYSNSLWKYSTNNPVQEMHICYNNILYTIDWSELSIPSINFPIGIVFNTNELKPIPSRESIEYNINSRKLIKERIEEVKDWFLEKMIEKYKNEYVNIFDYKNILNKPLRYDIDEIYSLSLSAINIKPSDLDIKIKYFDTPELEKYVQDSKLFDKSELPFTKTGFINYNYSVVTTSYYHSLNTGDAKSVKQSIVLKKGESINLEKLHYILDKEGVSNPNIVREQQWDLKTYKRIMNLQSYPKEKWRELIKCYQDSIEDFLKENGKLYYYSDYFVNPNWHKDYVDGNTIYKTSNKKSKTITEKEKDKLLIYNLEANSYVFRKEYRTIDELKEYTMVIYDIPENEEKLRALHKLFDCFCIDNIPLFISTCKRNCNAFEKLNDSNLKSYEEYMDSGCEELKKVALGYVCAKLWKYCFYKDKTIFEYNTKFKEIYEKMQVFQRGYKKWNFPSLLAEEIYTLIKEKGELDYDFIKEVKGLIDLVNDIPVLQHISFSYSDTDNIVIVLDSIGFPLDKQYSETILERKIINFIDEKYGECEWECIE